MVGSGLRRMKRTATSGLLRLLGIVGWNATKKKPGGGRRSLPYRLRALRHQSLERMRVTDGTRPGEVWKQQQPNLELRKRFQRQDELGDRFRRRLALQEHRSIEPPLLATHPRIRADRQVFDELAQVAIVATPRRLRLGIILGGDGQRLTDALVVPAGHGPPGYSQERVIGGSFSPAVTLTLIDSRLPLMSLTRRIVCGPGLIAKSRSGVCWIFLPSM
jgi:hypothetical protein